MGWEAIAVQVIMALVEAGVKYEQASEAGKAELAAQATAAVAALKGEAAAEKADHEARTAETIKEIA